MMEAKYFKFYESCVPVLGANRGVVCDLLRGNLYFLPKLVLQEFMNYSSSEISQFYSDFEDSKLILKKYFNYLLENELIFFLDNPNHFPKINTTITKPFSQDVLFLEIDSNNLFLDYFSDIKKLNNFGFTEIVIISTKNNLKEIELVLKKLEDTRIYSVKLLIKYQINFTKKLLKIISNSNLVIEVLFFESNKNESYNNVFYFKATLKKLLTKKIQSVNDFVLNQNAYFEAKSKNLYFNRKVYIDSIGNIKHSFDDDSNYGNINTDLLEDVVNSDSFKELCNISKEEIEVCKDCEFRLICPDNRIPNKRKKNDFYHITQCNYDPYKNEWK